MKIKIKYTAQLKKAIGKAEDLVDVNEGINIEGILNHLNKIYSKEFANIVFNQDGQFMNAVLLILNGKQIAFNSEKEVKENDVITIMSPIAGG